MKMRMLACKFTMRYINRLDPYVYPTCGKKRTRSYSIMEILVDEFKVQTMETDELTLLLS